MSDRPQQGDAPASDATAAPAEAPTLVTRRLVHDGRPETGELHAMPTAELLVPRVPTGTTVQPIEAEAAPRGLAGLALGVGIAGLLVACFVGWGFPIGIAGVVASIVALRRPIESRPIAIWGLSLSVLSLVYSAGWLLFAALAA